MPLSLLTLSDAVFLSVQVLRLNTAELTAKFLPKLLRSPRMLTVRQSLLQVSFQGLPAQNTA
jgi:hypothetical protein